MSYATSNSQITPDGHSLIDEKRNGVRSGVIFMDSSGNDAFSRWRVSQPTTMFESQFQYDQGQLFWESVLTGGGTATHLPNESSIRLRVATSGDSVVRQSRSYLRYRPGKSLQIAETFVMGPANANVTMQVGYFDAKNGIFLQRAGSAVSFVRRTFTSGVAVDVVVPQASWNIDPMNGTGPSELTLDLTKSQILMIDLQWLGVGRVRLGFDIDGEFWPCHQFLNANNLSTVYMTTANLPIRYSVEATGAPGGNVDFIQICSVVASEGGFETYLGTPRTISNGVTTIGVTTRRPILSIRPSLTFNSITNRALILPEQVELTAATNNGYWELVYGGTLTGASFASVGANSCVDYDVAATAISSGTVIGGGYVLAGAGTVRGQIQESILSFLPLTLNVAGASPIPLSVVVTSFTGTCNVSASMTWRELL